MVFAGLVVLLLATATQLTSASPGSALSKAVIRFFSSGAGQEVSEQLTQAVAEEVSKRVANRLRREGGETAVSEASELTARYGPNIIRALDNSPVPAKVLKSLGELPAEEVSAAAARLVSGRRGQSLAQATEELGTEVLRAEVKHPGVGLEFVRAWPDGGGTLCRRLSPDEAITLGKYLDDLAEVPADQKRGLLEVVNANKDRFFVWLGKFVEANPGRTIGSATFLAAFLPNAERILGGDEIVYDAKGTPVVLRKLGLVEAPASKLADAAALGIFWLLCAVAVVVTLWLAQILLVRGWWNARRG